MANRPARDDIELLRGAVDIHIHHAPDLYVRIQYESDRARAGCAFRRHARLLHQAAQFSDRSVGADGAENRAGGRLFGSLTCNRQVGGLNPIAVEAAIKYGVRQIWLPTIDSTNHEVVTGSVGQHGKGLTIKGGISDYALKQPRLFCLDQDGAVLPELKEIIAQVSDAGIILNLGHTSFKEMLSVIDQARRQNVKRMSATVRSFCGSTSISSSRSSPLDFS